MFQCGDIGHKKLSCPHRAVQPRSSGSNTDEVQRQFSEDSQWENTGGPEIEGNEHHSTDTVEPKIEEVSAKPNSDANDANTVNNADTNVNPCTDADLNPGAGDSIGAKPEVTVGISRSVSGDTGLNADTKTVTNPTKLKQENTQDSSKRKPKWINSATVEKTLEMKIYGRSTLKIFEKIPIKIPGNSTESLNSVMSHSENPECSAGATGEHLTHMEEGEISSGEVSY